MVERIKARKERVNIAVVGKYIKLHDAYLSVAEALRHGGYENGCKVDIKWIEAEDVTDETAESILSDVSGILVPGGFGDRGIEGKVAAAKYARDSQDPVLWHLSWNADRRHQNLPETYWVSRMRIPVNSRRTARIRS